MILHRYELRQASQLSNVLKGGKLIRPHGACAKIPHTPGSDEVVERLHRLDRIDSTVIAVYLKQIDVFGLHPLQRFLYSVEDCVSRKPW